MSLRQLTLTALFVAVGVFSSHLIYVPVGIAKCFPVQHAINVLLAVLLGTRSAVGAAFATSLLRNLLGSGSLLAFPGSMIGAALAGIFYSRSGRLAGAVLGEVIGTGLLGALLAFPLAKFILGSQAGAFFFIAPFAVSSLGGSLLAWLLAKTPLVSVCRQQLQR